MDKKKIEVIEVSKKIREIFSFKDLEKISEVFSRCVRKIKSDFPVSIAMVEPFLIQYTKVAAIQHINGFKSRNDKKLKRVVVFANSIFAVIYFVIKYIIMLSKSFIKILIQTIQKKNSFIELDSLNSDYLLFVCSYINELNPQLPVIKQLVNDGQKVVLIVPDSAIKWKSIKHVDKRARIVCWSFIKTHCLIDVFKCITFGYVYTALCKKNGVLNSSKVSAHLLFITLQQISADRFFKKIIKKREPQKIIFGFVKRPLNAAIFWRSKKLGLKTYFLPHALFSASPYISFVFASGYIDYVFLHEENHFSKFNVQTSKRGAMFVVGNPMFDSMPYDESKAETKEQSNILFLDSASQLDEAVIVFEAIEKIPDANLVVKLHPQGNAQGYIILKKNYRINLTIIDHHKTTLSLEQIINGSKICIAGRTDASIEVLLAKRPLITLTTIKSDAVYNFENYGLPYASSSDELYKLLKRMIECNKHRQGIIDQQNNLINKLLWKKANTTAAKRISLILTDRTDEAVEKGTLIL